MGQLVPRYSEVRVEQSATELTVSIKRAHRRKAGNVGLTLACPYPVGLCTLNQVDP
jgi:hypothetical protein